MGRWTQYDEDEHRLPEGMQRVGYDADTGKYYFRDRSGSLWEGPQGAQYGEMKLIENAPVVHDEVHEGRADLEAAGVRADGYQPVASDEGVFPRLAPNSPYRTLFPFFMIIVVCLMLVWRLVHQSPISRPPEVVLCPISTETYRVQTGDTCWEISQSGSFSLDELLQANPGLACERLRPGDVLCLPNKN